MAKHESSVLSLFSGGLGLDLGLEGAGFTIRAAVECNRFAAETIRKNRKNLDPIEKKIEAVTTEELLKAAGLAVREATVVIGGPSCQSFSTAGHRESVTDPRGGMFREFLRVVNEAQPRFFVMENVKGVLSAAVKHRALKDRGPGCPALTEDEELGSAFRLILQELKATGYYIVFDVLNAANFGTPQTRERLVFIGSRDGEPVEMPKPTHAKGGAGGLLPWITFEEALKGLEDPEPVFRELSKSKKKYLKRVPAGGNWRDLPKKMQAEALGGAAVSWGGRSGFFRRLAWDKPAPALTTRPDSKATMLCHPTELRPLSVAEYTRLQQFPDNWHFEGGSPQQYLQVGNAVPVGLGEAIGRAIKKAMKKDPDKTLLGKIVCADSALLDRMVKRPRTILNPRRMRKKKKTSDAREWLAATDKNRSKLLDYIEHDVVEDAIPVPVVAEKRVPKPKKQKGKK